MQLEWLPDSGTRPHDGGLGPRTPPALLPSPSVLPPSAAGSGSGSGSGSGLSSAPAARDGRDPHLRVTAVLQDDPMLRRLAARLAHAAHAAASLPARTALEDDPELLPALDPPAELKALVNALDGASAALALLRYPRTHHTKQTLHAGAFQKTFWRSFASMALLCRSLGECWSSTPKGPWSRGVVWCTLRNADKQSS
jgi:hypothetical protein